MQLCVILRGCYKEGNSSLAGGQQFQRTVILARGTTRHYDGLLFIVYVIIRKTCYSKMLRYCTQLDCANIGSYVHRWKQHRRKKFPNGVLEISIVQMGWKTLWCFHTMSGAIGLFSY